MSTVQWLSLGIILLTYAGIGLGRVPKLRMNRTTVTLVGAGALLAIQAINQWCGSILPLLRANRPV